MDLDTFIIAVFCLFDDALPEVVSRRRLRRRGPQPTLADSEVLTMEVVDEFLSLGQDKALYHYFRRHWPHSFPTLRQGHRTTFVRQVASLWVVKQRLWRQLLGQIPHDPSLALMARFPLPLCRFARASRGHRFRGLAAHGHDALNRQTFYGFRCHVRLAGPGIITRFRLAAADNSELAVTPDPLARAFGTVVGNRNYWSLRVAQELRGAGIDLQASYRSARRDPHPRRSRMLSRIRYRIDTVFGQLVERFQTKTAWARHPWHLCNRMVRTVLNHTIAVLLNVKLGNPPLQLERLLLLWRKVARASPHACPRCCPRDLGCTWLATEPVARNAGGERSSMSRLAGYAPVEPAEPVGMATLLGGAGTCLQRRRASPPVAHLGRAVATHDPSPERASRIAALERVPDDHAGDQRGTPERTAGSGTDWIAGYQEGRR